jgi:hypothetical protein
VHSGVDLHEERVAVNHAVPVIPLVVSRTGWVPQGTYDRSLGRFRRALRDVPESGLAGELTSRCWVHVAPLLLLLIADVAAFVALTQHHVRTGSG